MGGELGRVNKNRRGGDVGLLQSDPDQADMTVVRPPMVGAKAMRLPCARIDLCHSRASPRVRATTRPGRFAKLDLPVQFSRQGRNCARRRRFPAGASMPVPQVDQSCCAVAGFIGP